MVYNYYFPTFSVSKASDMLGFNGKSKDKVPSSVSVTTPTDSAQKSIRSKVEATRSLLFHSVTTMLFLVKYTLISIN